MSNPSFSKQELLDLEDALYHAIEDIEHYLAYGHAEIDYKDDKEGLEELKDTVLRWNALVSKVTKCL